MSPSRSLIFAFLITSLFHGQVHAAVVDSTLAHQVQIQDADVIVSCSDQIEKVIRKRTNWAEGVAMGFLEIGWAVPVVIVGTATGSTGLALAAAAGTLAVVELPIMITRKHARNVRDLLIQAKTCQGKKIDKAWAKFSRKYEVAGRVQKAQFCAAIVAADLSGEACNGEKVPERSDVLRIAAEDLETQ